MPKEYIRDAATLRRIRSELLAEPREVSRNNLPVGALGAFERAEYCAGQYFHAQVQPIHLLFALTIMGDGGRVGAPSAGRELCRAGASRNALVAFFEQHPKLVVGTTRAGLAVSKSLMNVLKAAEKRAKHRAKVTRRPLGISQNDLLVCLLRSEDKVLREALAVMNIDRVALLHHFEAALPNRSRLTVA